MDDNAKRWMTFILFSCALVLIWGNMQQSKARKWREAHPEQITDTLPGANRTSLTTGTQTAEMTTFTSPDAIGPDTQTADGPTNETQEPGEDIIVQTNTYRVTFNTAGARPTSWQIIDPIFAKVAQADIDQALEEKRPADQIPNMGDPLPIETIPQYEGMGARRDYPLMTVLNQSGKYRDALNRALYEVDGPRAASFNADGTTKTIFISFTSPDTSGVRMTKTFHFPSDGYLTELEIRLDNTASAGGQNLTFDELLQPGLGLSWGPGIGASHYRERWDAGLYNIALSDGDEIISDNFGDWDDARQEKVSREWPMREEQAWRWSMVDSRFLMAAIIPQEPSPRVRGIVKSQHVPVLKADLKDLAPPLTTEIYSDGFRLRPGEEHSLKYTLFVGPKKYSLLQDIDSRHEGFDLRKIMFVSDWWISQKLIRPLAVFMLILLGTFHDWTGNYGVAIILVVLVMRLLTQPFTHMGMKSQARVMAEQKRIKPLIDAINEKYKDDPQKKSAETWKTYREHGVNPLGMLKGCGWMLVQMPIFFALYRLLMGAIDLRGEGFLWITDLTAPDALFTLPFTIPFLGNKFNILPILMGVSQVFAQRLQSNNIQDPMQKQMATIMPIMFVFILYNFAAGLSLYWFVSNIWQIIFQVFVNQRVKDEVERKEHKAFEARQKAVASGENPRAPGKKKNGKPSWRENLMTYLETKAKEAEKAKKSSPGKKGKR